MNNDEIREQEDIQMAHYKSLTPDEQADRERSLMDKARSDAIKNYPLMKKQEEEAIRADTAKQIFSELVNCEIDVNRLAPEEAIAAIQREPDVYWYWLLDGDKVDLLKKKYKVNEKWE